MPHKEWNLSEESQPAVNFVFQWWWEMQRLRKKPVTQRNQLSLLKVQMKKKRAPPPEVARVTGSDCGSLISLWFLNTHTAGPQALRQSEVVS